MSIKSQEFDVEEIRAYLFDMLSQLADLAGSCGEHKISAVLNALLIDHEHAAVDTEFRSSSIK